MNKQPKTYVLSLDSRCNQRCLICMKKDNISQGRTLTLNKVKSEIIKAKKEGYDHIDFFGGEPLSYTFITTAIQFANKLSLSCFLATNATKLCSQSFARYFFDKTKIKEVRTTLYSHRSTLHDRLTQTKNSHKKTVTGIKNILKFGKTGLSVNVVINSLNFRELPQVVDFIYDLGVRNMTFSGLTFDGEILNHTRLYADLTKIKPYLIKAVKKSLQMGLQVRLIKLPACILKKSDRHPSRYIFENNRNFLKLRSCLLCASSYYCPGVDFYQVSAFGIPTFLKNV